MTPNEKRIADYIAELIKINKLLTIMLGNDKTKKHPFQPAI